MPNIPYRLPQLTNTSFCDTIHTFIYVHKYDTVHTTINVDVDSLIAYSNFRESLSDYSTMFNLCLIVCTVVLASFTLYSVIKFVYDNYKINELKKNLESRIQEFDSMKNKLEKIKNVNYMHTEHIIQMWLNLSRVFRKKNDEEFEYIAYMQIIDALGKNFNKDDYNLAKQSFFIKQLKKLKPRNNGLFESGTLEEIDSIKRLIECLKAYEGEQDFIKDLQSLICSRLHQPVSEKKNSCLGKCKNYIKSKIDQIKSLFN